MPNKVKFFLSIIILIIVGAVLYFVASYVDNSKSSHREFKIVNPPMQKIQRTSSINIAGCIPNPNMAHTVASSTIRFVNPDSLSHVIFFKQGRYTVPAQGILDVHLGFLSTPGDKAQYDCDSHKFAGSIITAIVVNSTTTQQLNQKTSPKSI